MNLIGGDFIELYETTSMRTKVYLHIINKLVNF